MSSDEMKISTKSNLVMQVTTEIHVKEEVGTDDEWEFEDHFVATRQTYHGSTQGDGTYWLVSGDNTGSQQLVVWPYQIDGLIELLTRLKSAAGEGTE